MKVKIDTKEKMHVVMIEDEKITANMTEELEKFLLDFLEQPIKNIILNFEEVKEVELKPAELLTMIQQRFYEENHSLVFCNLSPEVSEYLDQNELLEVMNVTPTESEAWDIVQMEEIEREFL